MMKKIWAGFALAFVAAPVPPVSEQAQAVSAPSEREAFLLSSAGDAEIRACFKPAILRDVCQDVYTRAEDTTPDTPYSYRYERKVYTAACADFERDSEKLARKKIQMLWNENPQSFICNRSDFDVSNGSIIKLAAFKMDSNFIDLVSSLWQPNLNVVDPSDGMTALDYVRQRAVANKHNALGPRLNGYYRQLRAAGARHKSELPVK